VDEISRLIGEKLDIETKGVFQSSPYDIAITGIKEAAEAVVARFWRRSPPETCAWQPIETAPPKGQLIDVWTVGWGAEPHRVSDCYYDNICGEWRTSRHSGTGQLLCIPERFVTHWMPLPAAPDTEGR
jgi:hypothetical protein